MEAASSLVGRGVQALWIGGDVTVLVASESLIGVARKARIPVFTLTPPTAEKGALFDLGANFLEVGRQTGQMAVRILQGADPSTIPIVNFVPTKLIVNQQALAGLKDPWRIPEDILARADVLIDESGRKDAQRGAKSK